MLSPSSSRWSSSRAAGGGGEETVMNWRENWRWYLLIGGLVAAVGELTWILIILL